MRGRYFFLPLAVGRRQIPFSVFAFWSWREPRRRTGKTGDRVLHKGDGGKDVYKIRGSSCCKQGCVSFGDTCYVFAVFVIIKSAFPPPFDCSLPPPSLTSLPPPTRLFWTITPRTSVFTWFQRRVGTCTRYPPLVSRVHRPVHLYPLFVKICRTTTCALLEKL